MKPTKKELSCIKYASKSYKIPMWIRLFKNPIYVVSELKSFGQLWSDYGLRDYGNGFLNKVPFRKEDKIKCLQHWVEALYSRKIEIKKWYNEIDERLTEQLIKFYQNNPGCRIQMQKAEDLIIEEIEKKYGNYL